MNRLISYISDLGKDGCMSEFSWSSGGNYGKQWGEHLPTDAGVGYIVMSLSFRTDRFRQTV